MCFFIAGAVDSNLGKEVPRSLLRFKANSETVVGVINLVSEIRYQDIRVSLNISTSKSLI